MYELTSLRYLYLKYLAPVNDTAAASVSIYSLYLHLVLLMLAMLKTFQKKYSLQSFICGQYLIDFISKYRNVASDRNENGALVVRVGFA